MSSDDAEEKIREDSAESVSWNRTGKKANLQRVAEKWCPTVTKILPPGSTKSHFPATQVH